MRNFLTPWLLAMALGLAPASSAAWSAAGPSLQDGDRAAELAERAARDAARAAERAERDAAERTERAERDAAERAERAERDAADDRSGSSGSGSGSGGSDSGGDSDSRDEADDTESRDGGSSQGRQSGRVLQGLERDRSGRERLVNEILVLSDRAPAMADFETIEQRGLASLGGVLLRVRSLEGRSVEQSLATLRRRLPDAVLSAHHVYRMAADDVPSAQAAGPPVAGQRGGVRIGLVDTGVDLAQFVGVVDAARSFADDEMTAHPHGSTVARLAASAGAGLVVADVFDESGEVASEAAVAAAIDWLVGQGAQVINLSLQGPESPTLQAVIARAHARGVVLVAAGGNAGANAKPMFPAAYPEVIAVTAVDEAGSVYWRANRGSYLDFAAVGVNLQPCCDLAQRPVSGTSFAAPQVAAALGAILQDAPQMSPDAARAQLRQEAVDLGPRGRDRIFGWGLVRPAPRSESVAKLN